jgi:hypothetical protein
MTVKLRTTIAKLGDVPEPQRQYYQPCPDGTWQVAIEGDLPGFVAKAVHDEQLGKLNEFRDNNRALNASNIELTTKLKAFEGVDAAANTAAAAKLAELEQKYQGIDPVEFKALKERPDLSPRVTELEAALAVATSAKTTAQATADKAVFRSKIADVFLRNGGRPQALEFEIAEAEKVFALKDGQLTTQAFSADKPGEALSVDEWIAAQMLTSSFAFAASSGGGSSGANSSRTREGKTIVSTDPVEFGMNIEKIAKGEAIVQ